MEVDQRGTLKLAASEASRVRSWNQDQRGAQAVWRNGSLTLNLPFESTEPRLARCASAAKSRTIIKVCNIAASL